MSTTAVQQQQQRRRRRRQLLFSDAPGVEYLSFVIEIEVCSRLLPVEVAENPAIDRRWSCRISCKMRDSSHGDLGRAFPSEQKVLRTALHQTAMLATASQRRRREARPMGRHRLHVR